MKRLAARQTRYVNKLEGRTGTLWESRYKSSPVDTEAYLLTCSAYVELNPIRARLVAHPEDYPWSSYGHKIGKVLLSWLDIDPCYESLGRTSAERQQEYRRLVEGEIDEERLEMIRQSVQQGQLTGSEKFSRDIAEQLGRRIPKRGRGRPRIRPSRCCTEK